MKRPTVFVSLANILLLAGCIGSPDGTGKAGVGHSSAESRQFPLETLPIATISINEHEFRVWLATDSEQQLEGLMHVPEEEVADDQGMLFVFPYEYLHSFWMKDTIIPLDIAYARADGTIVKIWTMPPLTYRTFPSIEPAMFALEVKAGTFERLGIHEADRIIIPEEVFKTSP